MQIQECRQLIINTALGAGNNVIIDRGTITGPGAGIGTIKVWQILLETSAAVTITPYSAVAPANTTLIQQPGTIVLTGAGAAATLQATGEPWMKTLPGQSLVWNLSAGGTLTGSIAYTLA